jgi:hypothetical protein
MFVSAIEVLLDGAILEDYYLSLECKTGSTL